MAALSSYLPAEVGGTADRVDPTSDNWQQPPEATYVEPEIWEIAPTTDEEWAEALKSYAFDRHSEVSPSKGLGRWSTVDRGAPLVETPYKEDELLHHMDSDTEELLFPDDGRPRSAQRTNQHTRKFSWTPADDAIFGMTSNSGSQSPAVDEGSDWHWPPPRPQDSFTVVGVDLLNAPAGPSSGPATKTEPPKVSSRPPPSMPPPPIPLNARSGPLREGNVTPELKPQSHPTAFSRHTLSDLIGLPPQVSAAEDDGISAEEERRRLRALYEEKGYLPAPTPSRKTRLLRASALRRLGLSGDDDSSTRYAVISKYTDLLCMIFDCRKAGVSIFRGDEEIVYLSHIQSRYWTFPAEDALAAHALQSSEWQCWVCGNMNKDWRFKNNKARGEGGKPILFATAPLRYHLPDGEFVDFGALIVTGAEERPFGTREQAMLLRISNMLVFQLATLQSEVMAKQSRAMYESSINFLRRCFIPERLKGSSPKTSKEDKKKRSDRKRHHQPHPRHYSHGHGHGHYGHASHHRNPLHSPRMMLSRSHSPAPSPVPTPPTPTRATKTGPRDAKQAKRRDLESEEHLFSDAAHTLRGILQADAVAMVDLREFQLFVRKTTTNTQAVGSKESIVSDFLQGKSWPSNAEPVVNFVPRYSTQGVHVLGRSCSRGTDFDFSSATAPDVMRNFVKTYLSTRQYWWDRGNESDELAQKLMMFMPFEGQTVLAAVFMTFSGALRYATFAVWSRPAHMFDDSSRLALPFVWIIGAALMSSLAIHRVWAIEESQISYSNLQAHELRTPLHQILAITQLLRSSISDFAEAPVATPDSGLTTLQQVRDLLPLLDAIDTSGTTLHGIVENILTFLDLSAKDYRWGSIPGNPTVASRTGAPKPLGVMLEEIIHEAYDEDRRSRLGSGQPLGHIETIFEIIPRDLGELVTEDYGGALRRALARIIHNAYRYIEVQGCVEIYIDDIKSMLPPEGCEDLANTRRISITVVDNGRGMSSDFVREHLGEPWAKEDLYATGSGLSVHLAYRIVDLMNGEMEITSAPGSGCTVMIEVPVPVARDHRPPPSPLLARKVAFVGFDRDLGSQFVHLARLGASLESQYRKLNCEIVEPEEAELVIADGSLEDDPVGLNILAELTAPDVVIFAANVEDERNIAASMTGPNRRVRRHIKPITPTLIQQSLVQASPSVPQTPTEGILYCQTQPRPRPHFEPEVMARQSSNSRTLPWKPRGVCVEEAVAALSLGDYISSRNRLSRASSYGSNGSNSVQDVTSEQTQDYSSPEASGESESRWSGVQLVSPLAMTSEGQDDDESEATSTPNPAKLPVLVVEDNAINRRILVKILKSILPHLEILEAEDGMDAVERFRQLGNPAIVLLDINMPRMDGYATAIEMRMIEKRRALEAAGDPPDGTVTPAVRSKIIAITALSGENERHRGLVECGMDAWVTKPCGKSTLQKVVDDARQELALLS